MEYVELANMCMIEDTKNRKVLVQNRIKGSWTGIDKLHTMPLASSFEKMLTVFLDEKLNEDFITIDFLKDQWTHILK